MNWTGGALSRSRNANAKFSLSLKQKNHFAKARAKLQNEQRPSPPKIQYFDFGEWKPESGVHDHRRPDLVKRKAPSQKTLDQFENVQGVVKKLKSLRPRNKGDKRKRSPIDDTEGHVLPSGIAIPPISPSTISSGPPSSSSPIGAELSVQRTLKRLRTSTSPTCDEVDSGPVLDGVEVKRRKLLQERDWAGIERQKRMSKPVKMKFTDAKDRDLIGRRRPLNGSAIQNRWNVQGAKRSKLPLMVSHFENPQGLHHGFVDENWNADGISIRIGSTATNKGPMYDEMLDDYRSPRPAQRSSDPVETYNDDNLRPTPKPQPRRREVATPSAFRDEFSEPFRSLFSPEDVEPSGIAQLVEAATIADNDHLSHAKDELQLPEDYHFPEPEPEFRLIFERTPRPRGQTTEINDSSSSIVRNYASTEAQLPGAAIEQSARPDDHHVLQERMYECAPVGDAKPSTSPLSIATSRYIQELERQSFGSDGRRLTAKNIANQAATAGPGPAMDETIKPGKERGTTGDEDPKVPAQPHGIHAKEPIPPTEDEDEIWRTFINLDGDDESPSIQEQPTSTNTARPPPEPEARLPDRVSAQKAPPSPRDDELAWQTFIFSDAGPNDDWIIEEASPASPYNAALTQASMVAEAATSPVKRNPHLTDEALDSTPTPDHAHASTAMTTSDPSPFPTTEPPSPTGATQHPSSDELSWTPSRLPGKDKEKEKEKGKVVFTRPSRYEGPKSPEPVHLGRRATTQRTKKKRRGLGQKESHEEGDTERDDIVDV